MWGEPPFYGAASHKMWLVMFLVLVAVMACVRLINLGSLTMTRTAYLSCSILLATCGAVPVLAADATSPTYSETVFSEGRWGVSVGGFAGFAPAYEGSDEFRFVGYPLILPKYYGDNYDPNVRSRVDFRSIDDVRFSLLRLGGLDVGPLAGYSFGRDEDLANRLTGMGDVDGGITVGGFASYTFEPFFVDIAYNTQVTGDTDTGYTLRFGAGIETNLSERMVASAYVGSTYASADYMDAYFSVTPAQSAASGLAVYDASSGIKNVGLDLGLDYRMTDRVTLKSKAGYYRLLGDAADSPVTASRNQFSGGLGVTYTFGRTD